ncbi:ankyrin repeat-containing domain protein [Colletotrichum phormii]|uniref:Ankyrin repeat-containing domain protein n=1 Tax=Colletotrichum phormii TaxID=359342 RepID=A0AAJ0E9Y0_9PEZI|nr:ankyrin repeat-containing domain protein [Colletotrichum phormii]KAK1622143.1 ankyrin repeat-containing domain protein [Colletotrichum phormii]
MQDYNEFEAQQKRHMYPDTLMKRAVYEAACGNHASLVALLLDNGASVTDSVVMAVYRGRDKTILKEILKRGFEINTVEPGASLLTLSVGHIEWMEVLLHHGADPNVKGSRGKTALHSAVIQPSLRPCQLLLDHSARLPRDILKSAIGCTGASMEMIKFLVDKGADLSYVRNIKTGYKI